jgi:hypothetical protein
MDHKENSSSIVCLDSLPQGYVYLSEQQKIPFLCCCTIVVFVCYCGNMFTEPLPRNVSGIFAYLAVVA